MRQSEPKAEELLADAVAKRARLEVLVSRSEDDSERVQANLDFTEANQKLEIFILQHDPTGALKRETIGSDLAEQLSERLFSKSELPPAQSPERITPVFLVNMGELDRLNKVDESFGNQALTRLADVISKKLHAGLGEDTESFYKIYRADNNSFMVRFLRDIPKEVAEALRESFSCKAGNPWEAGEEDVFTKRGVESAPVIADFVSVEEVLSGMPPELRSSGKAETYAVGALKDVLFALQDARKIVSRVERMRDVMPKTEMSQEDAAAADKKAQDLYDKYLKKSVAKVFTMEVGSGTEVQVDTYEQLKDYLAFLARDPHPETQLLEAAFGKVLTDLRIRYEKDGVYTKQLQDFVMEKAEREYGVSVQEKMTSKAADVGLPADRAAEHFEEPNRDEATEGLRELARLRTEVGAARDNLEKAEAQATPEYLKQLKQYTRIVENSLTIERLKRDPATGLELRGSMFKKLEAALAEGTKRVATFSMDMGFLKYFDQVGGRATGDLAILKVAEVFQKVKDAFSKDGLEISVYRLGGDEFGLSVIGDSNIDLKDFEKRMGGLQAALLDDVEIAGAIPSREGARPGYYATDLELGVGYHVYANGRAAEEEDRKYGLSSYADDESTKINKRVEHSVKVADKVMGLQKSAGRMLTLLEYMRDIARGKTDEAVGRAQLEQLKFFSSKAIFADKGVAKLEELGAQIAAGKEPEELDAEVHVFVREQMAVEHKKEEVEGRIQEVFVEQAVRIEHLSGRVAELQARLDKAERGEGEKRVQDERNKKILNDRLSAAEEELAAIRDQRAGIRAAA